MRSLFGKLLRPLGLALVSLFVTASVWAGSTTVVISQIYTAGGNSGATYNADYVELHNVSSTTQSLSGFALQYSSATGTTTAATVIALPPGVSLQPGQYYLIAGSTGANGTALPTTADTTLSGLAMGASGGRISLTNNTTALPASNLCTGTNIVDFVGYGNAVCYEGSAAAPTATTTLASIRAGSGCTDTDQNGADFTTGTPAPHNSSSSALICGGGGGTTGISLANANANPSSVQQGSSTLLSVKVTAGTNPASTGLTVKADLTAFSGSATQVFYDDGTHGDATLGDGVYSYTLTAPASAPLGAQTINLTASDSQLRTANTTISVTVLTSAALLPIHTIQGGTPATSPYSGQTVTTSGIVTGVRVNGFYIQARDNAADSDPTTPEGIFIHTGTGNNPASAVIGNELQLSGTVALYPAGGILAGTELDNPNSFTVLSTSNTLPAAITLTTTNPSPSGGIYQLARYQSMRVAVPSLTTTSGTDGTFDEPNELYTSNGTFYGQFTGVARAVREPGLEVLDAFTAGQPSTIARFDDNPEVFEVDSNNMLGSPAPLDVTTNTVLTNMSGVMDFSGGAPLFLIDAANRPTVSGSMMATAVPVPASNETTVGDLNMERFYNTVKDTAGAVVITQAAYTRRLQKASLAIRNLFRMPDIMAVEEVENLATLTDLSTQISTDTKAAGQTDPQYAPYLVIGNDSSGISVGFLVKTSKVTVNDVTQFGKTTTFTQPSTGSQATLNDRPPLVLHAGIKRTGGSDYPLTVIVNHLRSLNGVSDNTGSGQNVRAKREQQAEYLAKLIQGYQTAGEHVIAVGDFNAFEFNDGLVDSLDIIRGIVTPANQDVVPGPATALVSPALVDVAPTNLAKGDYSYVFVGNAQSIDHFLVTQDIASIVHTSPVHLNADFPVVYRNDATRPERTSDHDGFMGYIAIPGLPALTITPSSLDFGAQTVKTTSTLPVTVKNAGTTTITFTSIAATPGSTFSASGCGTSLAAGASCTENVSFTPTTTNTVTGTLTFTDNDVNGTQSVSLTGSGLAASGTPALTATATNVVAGTSVTFTATVTGNSSATPTGTVTFYDGNSNLGQVTLVSGSAQLSTSALLVGPHNITVTYNGDSTYPTSTSAPLTVTVTAPASAVALVASSNNVVAGTSVTFTATVTGNAAAAPTGTVTFLDGNSTLGTATVTAGKATFSTSALTVTTHSVTARYGGDNTYPAYTSAAVSVIVTAAPVPDFTFSVANGQLIVTQSAPSSSTTLNVAMVNGYSQTVTFTCSSVPANTRCSFSPTSLSASGSSTLTVTINTVAAALEQMPGHISRIALAFTLFGLPLLLTLRKRARRFSAVLGLLLLGGAMACINGCGGNAPSTPTGTSNVTVTATGGSVTHTATFSLVVQ